MPGKNSSLDLSAACQTLAAYIAAVYHYTVSLLLHFLHYSALLCYISHTVAVIVVISVGSWEFSAAQLEQAEFEIEDCNRVIEELTLEIQDRYFNIPVLQYCNT